MKRYIPIVASLMVFSLISCGEVMDLTQPEKLDAVREYLRGFLRNPDELALTHERHMAVARQVLDKLRDARAGLASGGLIDLAAAPSAPQPCP